MLHLHNGDITAALARRANIPGRHAVFREMLIAGPLPANLAQHDWIERRARFISENYDQNLLRVRNEMIDQEKMLDDCRQEDEIVLWFEHDLFCLAMFLYLLVRLAKIKHLTCVWSPNPLGTLTEEQIGTLFLSRAAVPPHMHRTAASVWEGYTSDDPLDLNKYLLNPVRDFPFLHEGLHLHASRFPSTRDGLGEVERRAMETLAAGPANFVTLFARFDGQPPQFGFGDGEFLRHLRRLATCAVPMITISENDHFAITPAGRSVLEGKADFIDLNNAGFWLGGAYLNRERLWRWDAARGEIVWSGAVH